MNYNEKLEHLLSKSPNDKFYKSCLKCNNLSDCQKAWIDCYFHRDASYVNNYYGNMPAFANFYQSKKKITYNWHKQGF